MSSAFSDNAYTGGSGRTITAFFDSRDDAQRALDRLDALDLPAGSAKLVRGNDATADNGDNESRGFWESLSDFFFPDDDRATYAEGLRRGGFLVTATAIPADKYDEALDILDDEGSVDVDARSSEWRSEGWTGSAYGDGKPFDRSAASASDLSMAGTGVAASAFSGAKLSGGTAGYDEGRDLSTAQTGTDVGTSGSAAARMAASGDTDLTGVGGPAMDADRDAGFDRNTGLNRDEAITSAAAPVASDAARMDAIDGDLAGNSAMGQRTLGRRDTETGRARARSYSYDGIADTARGIDVEVEDERETGRGKGTLGRQVDAGTRR